MFINTKDGVMPKKNYIVKIADLFSVSIATLRYWGKEGLVKFDHSEENGYRTWSMHTLRTLCDITLYRQLSIPIQDLKHIHELNAEEIYSLLQCRREYICDMIEDLQDKLKHIDIKSDQVNTVRTMLYSEPSFLSLSLPAICAYELLNKENLSHLYDHEKELVILIQPQTPSRYDYGRFTAVPANPGTLLRPKDDAPRVYLHVLLKSSYEDPADNDLAIYYDYLKMHNYRPGPAIGRVLVSACEGRLMNYYDTYIEAIPFKTSTIFQKDGIS